MFILAIYESMQVCNFHNINQPATFNITYTEIRVAMGTNHEEAGMRATPHVRQARNRRGHLATDGAAAAGT